MTEGRIPFQLARRLVDAMQLSKLGPRMRGFRLLESKRGSTSFARMRPACCVFRVVLSCRRRRLGWIVKTRRAASSLVRLEMLESSSNGLTQLRSPRSLKQNSKTECVPRLARSTRVQADNHRNQHNALCCCRKSRQRERGRRRTRHPSCHLAEQIVLARPLFSPASANRSPGQASDPPPTAACSPRKFARDRPRHWSRPRYHGASANIVSPDPLISATSMLRLGPSRS